jgi:hypothetical protein
MNTHTSSYVMIQKHPFWENLAFDHPCVNNLRPVYIDRYDRIIKIKTGPSRIDLLLQMEIFKMELNLQEDPVQKVEFVNLPFKQSQRLIEETSKNEIIMTTPIKMEKETRKTFFNGLELLDLDTTSNTSLVENLIPKKEITVLAGKGDTGKSLLYLNLSLAIVLKQELFLGYKIFPCFNSVLIISTEDGEATLKDRVIKQALGITGQTSKQLKDAGLIKNLLIRVVQENLLGFIENVLNENKVDLLVLDALGDIIEGDENSQKDVRLYYDKLYSIIAKHDCAILIIAHENKASGKRSNRNSIIGSTAIVDKARSVLMLARDQKELISKSRTLTIVKANYISDELKGKPIKLQLNSNTITFSLASTYSISSDINSETSFVAEHHKKQKSESATIEDKNFKSRKNKPGRKQDEDSVRAAFGFLDEGISIEDIADILNVHKTTVYRWLKGKRPEPLE